MRKSYLTTTRVVATLAAGFVLLAATDGAFARASTGTRPIGGAGKIFGTNGNAGGKGIGGETNMGPGGGGSGGIKPERVIHSGGGHHGGGGHRH